MSHDAGVGAVKGVAAQAKKQDACVEDNCNRTRKFLLYVVQVKFYSLNSYEHEDYFARVYLRVKKPGNVVLPLRLVQIISCKIRSHWVVKSLRFHLL